MATGLTLTVAGAEEISKAYNSGKVVEITSVAIGDGGGAVLPVISDELADVTALYGEFGKEKFNADASDEGFISGQIVINCKNYPGKTLREVGMVSSSGKLIAYGVYPDTYLPEQTDSVIKEVILTLVMELTHASSVKLIINPASAVLTLDQGNKLYLRISNNLSDVQDKATARTNLDLKGAALLDVGTAAGTVAAGDDNRITGAMQKMNNLSDIQDKAAARTNLGLKGAALLDVGTTAGTVAAGNDSRITGALQKTNNLSDIPDKPTARTNLGLKGAALLDVGTTAGTVAAGNDSRITGALQKTNNLSDIQDKPTARTNLGLKGAALLDVGTTAGTVAAGNDSRITGALQKTNNLSDIQDKPTARTNLGLKGAALLDVGTTAGTVAAGNDSRITGALQKTNNLSDIPDKAEARKNLGLNIDGDGFKAIVDAMFYKGIVISGETSPALQFPWQTWEDLGIKYNNRVLRIGAKLGDIGGNNSVKILAENLPPHFHKSGYRAPGEIWDNTTTNGTDNQKGDPLRMTGGTYTDAAGLNETPNKEIDVTNEYVTMRMWKRTA